MRRPFESRRWRLTRTTRRSDDPENQHHKSPLFSKPPASYENALARSLSDKPSGARASWRSVRRHVIVLPQGPDEDVEEAPEEEEEQEDPEMAQALRDACFEAARIAANDSSERPTKTAFAIFKETSMKAAVRHAVSDLPHAIDATRGHLTMTWVVPFSILSRFGPRRGRRGDGVRYSHRLHDHTRVHTPRETRIPRTGRQDHGRPFIK